MILHGDLFAGILGFGEGFRQAGMRSAWHVEKDPACQRIIRRHDPGVPVHGDVLHVGKHNLCPVDVISFGSPCQDLSIAGQRAGLEGSESGLFYEGIRVVGELQPAIAVWENVPGAFSSNAGRDFASVLVAFRQCGARDIAWGVLDAQYFGVPQRRRRVFVVADFRGERAADILFESLSRAGYSTQGRKAGSDLAPCLESGTNRSGGHRPPGTTVDTAESLIIASALQASAGPHGGNLRGDGADNLIVGPIAATIGQRMRGQDDACANNLVVGTLSASGAGTARTGNARSEADMLVTTGTLGTDHRGRGANGADPSFMVFDWQSGGDVRLNVSDRLTSAQGTSQTPAVMATALTSHHGRLDDQDVAEHQVSGHGVRRLTPTECERLQGFPDGWTSGQSDSTRYKQLGNAVCVPVARWLGEQIVRILEA